MRVGTRTGPTPARMLGAMPTEEPEVKRKRGRPPKNSKPLPPASEDPSQLAPKEEEVYEVEAIRAMRMTKDGHPQYLIKWVGFADALNTWQSIDDLNCPELLSDFKHALAKNPALDQTEPGTAFPPTVCKDAWEDLVEAIDGLREIRDEDGEKQIVARILWKCGFETEELLEDCIEAVPRSMLRFLLTKLKFKSD